jgi:cytoskeleton protein RodZ
MPREERAQPKLAITMADERQVDFGTYLRQAREQRGVSLQELAVATKISARLLESLEHNDPSKLPGGIFSRAFVRAYAHEVGLDPEVAVANFVSAFPDESGAEDMPATTRAVEAESFQQGRRAIRLLLRVLGLALLAGVIALVYYSWPRRGSVPGSPGGGQPAAAVTMPQVPAQPPAQAPAVETPPSGAQAEAVPVDTAPSASAAPGEAQAEPAVPSPVQPSPSPGQPSAPVAAAAGQVPLVVVLTLTEPCWLSVSVDGTRSPSRTAQAGERIEYAVQRSITLTAGNAGALSVTLNGRPARPLGAAGEVVTTTISASTYESFLR